MFEFFFFLFVFKFLQSTLSTITILTIISSEPRIALCYLMFLELNFRRLNLRACVLIRCHNRTLKSRMWIRTTDPWVVSRVRFHCAILFLIATSMLETLRTSMQLRPLVAIFLTTLRIFCWKQLQNSHLLWKRFSLGPENISSKFYTLEVGTL